MKKQLILIGITILVIFLSLSGCNEIENSRESEEEKFIGNWIEINKEIGTPTHVYFTSNNSFYGGYWPLGDTWELKDGKILMSLSYEEEAYAIYYYEFKEDDTFLKLTNLNYDKSYTF